MAEGKMKLSSHFYGRSAIEVARDLLGKILVHQTKEGVTSGKIVETESYLPFNDPACHAARGKTKRNYVMFGKPGRSYVYFIYGNYYCLNAVCEKEGTPAAVLIRALEPQEGISLMQKRRKVKEIKNLCSGPGKLCQALGIKREENDQDLTKGNLVIKPGEEGRVKIIARPRIGIEAGSDKLLRFYIEGSAFISKP